MRETIRLAIALVAPLGAYAVFAGGIALLASVIWLVISERRKSRNSEPPLGPTAGPPQSRGWVIVLVLTTAVGAALRLSSLDASTISHPEIYIPGQYCPANAQPAGGN